MCKESRIKIGGKVGFRCRGESIREEPGICLNLDVKKDQEHGHGRISERECRQIETFANEDVHARTSAKAWMISIDEMAKFPCVVPTLDSHMLQRRQ
jgi:hypothetical protein